jgi:hypothetical protein
VRVAPNRNTARYLFGHLIAVHDLMGQLIGVSSRRFEFLDPLFLSTPDGEASHYPGSEELRDYWRSVHDRLDEGILAMSVDKWARPHVGLSDADFERRPWRNRYSILLSRTSHLAIHMGQLRLIQE